MTRDQGIPPIATGLLAQESAAVIAKVWHVAIDVERLEIPTFLCPSRRPVHFLLGEHQPDRIGGSNQRPLQREKTVPGGRCGIRNITHKECQS